MTLLVAESMCIDFGMYLDNLDTTVSWQPVHCLWAKCVTSL